MLGKDLAPGTQRPVGQAEIVDGAEAQDPEVRIVGAVACHERAAFRAKVVRHCIARGDRLGLCKRLEQVVAAHKADVVSPRAKVGRKRGGRDLVAVRAVAYKRVD